MPLNERFYSILSDPHSLVNDALIRLPWDDATGNGVVLGIQCKEWKMGGFLENLPSEIRKNRVMYFTWKKEHTAEEVSRFFGKNEFVHVLATPHKLNFTPAPEEYHDAVANVKRTIHEAHITRDDIHKWSPMVAISGCDARVR